MNPKTLLFDLNALGLLKTLQQPVLKQGTFTKF